MEIVVCTDKNFVRLSGVLFKSICVNNPNEQIRFNVVIDNSVSEEDKMALEKVIHIDTCSENNISATEKANNNCSIRFFCVDSEFMDNYPNLKQNGTITKAAYYRLMLAEILSDIDKVLYLDGDIVVRHSLKALFDTDISSYAAGVVTDMDENNMKRYDVLGYDSSLGFFNSGVMLLNLKYWRENHIAQKCFDFINNHGDRIIYGHDQDVLNYVLRESKLQLPLTYNVQNGFLYKKKGFSVEKYQKEWEQAIKDPVIIHYACSKPWIKGFYHPWSNVFFKYQNMTQWKDTPLKERKKTFSSYWHNVMLFLHIHHKKEYIQTAPLD